MEGLGAWRTVEASELYLRDLQQPSAVLFAHVYEAADLSGSDERLVTKHVRDDSLKCLFPRINERRSITSPRTDLQEICIPIEVPRPGTRRLDGASLTLGKAAKKVEIVEALLLRNEPRCSAQSASRFKEPPQRKAAISYAHQPRQIGLGVLGAEGNHC